MPTKQENPPTTLTELAAAIARLEDQATEYREAVKAIDDQIARHKAAIRMELGMPSMGVPAGDLVINWAPPKRTFHAAAFFQQYPAEKNPHLYKLVPNADAIPKSLKEQFMIPGTGDGTVTIK